MILWGTYLMYHMAVTTVLQELSRWVLSLYVMRHNTEEMRYLKVRSLCEQRSHQSHDMLLRCSTLKIDPVIPALQGLMWCSWSYVVANSEIRPMGIYGGVVWTSCSLLKIQLKILTACRIFLQIFRIMVFPAGKIAYLYRLSQRGDNSVAEGRITWNEFHNDTVTAGGGNTCYS